MGPAASDIPPRTWQYRPVRKIPQAAGLYLAVLEFIFTLGWTVYAIYLPKLAASVGIAAGTVIFMCHSGVRSRRACALASRMGVSEAWQLEGGLLAWKAEIDPTLRL